MTSLQPQASAQQVIDSFPLFKDCVDDVNRYTHETLEFLQVNVGRRCNLSCKHCHVNAGPHRNELMTRETMQQCLDVFVARGFKTIDITGGAPEMNPDFEWFISEASERKIPLMIRSNLVILDEQGYTHLPQRYAEIGATVVASLPHYTRSAMEKQRGETSFDRAIAMLLRLNRLGYGQGGDLELDLVFNPGGAFLPPDQAALEKEYKQRLARDYGIVFDNLFAVTNNPLGRFGEFLQRSDNLEGYMNRLVGAFNEGTLSTMMCRNQLSVGWDGVLYDCDFNQAAEISCIDGLTIADLAADESISLKREIRFGNHCFACCAGSGSSCGGTTA